MKKNGFTLIELLAVIVILAIIALIAVPIVINIINDSKRSSEEESLKLYEDAVNKMIVKKQMTDPLFNPKQCTILSDGNLDCEGIPVTVEVKGKTPNRGTVIIGGNKISFKNVEFNGKTYHETYAKLVNDADHDGKVSIGDEYTYKVNATDTRTFYVLSIDGDKVNLIMDSNICNDGTIPTSSKPCKYAWHWQTQEWDEDNNNYGPDIAMTNLYKGTKGWTNVPDMIMNYKDENNSGTNYGYTSIMTDKTTKVTTITGKQNKTSTNQTFGNVSEPLKARLPREDEVISTEAGCHVYSTNADNGTCSAWLMKNLVYSNVSIYTGSGNTDKYSINNNNGITNIYGYWLLASNSGTFDSARDLSYYGVSYSTLISYAGSCGIRPVITVSESDL